MHPLKEFSSIFINDDERSINANDVHPSNEPPPIVVTDDGMLIFIKDLHPLKEFRSVFLGLINLL